MIIMESLFAKKKMNKRGVLGLNTVKTVIISLLVLAVVAIAVFLALESLNTSNIFTDGSQAANNTNDLINNVTSGTTLFFTYVPTFMVLLAVVVLILIIAIVILAVTRFETGGPRESL